MLNKLILSAGVLFLLSSACAKKEKITICFTGDLLLDRGVREQINRKGVAALFEKVQPLFAQSDFVVVNLECPVTRRNTPTNKQYIFRAEPQWLKTVQAAGVTHLVMANNHTNDQGRTGMRDTYRHITANHMVAVGYGPSQAASCKPVILEKGKLRVALFASVLVPLENWTYLPDSAGICQATVSELSSNIRHHKAAFPADHVVVVLHWGVEFQSSPLLAQREDAQRLVEAGADAIIGHHPHVVQPESYYNGKPVFFSLGNFVFDQRLPLAQQGRIVQLTFEKDTLIPRVHPIRIKDCIPEPN